MIAELTQKPAVLVTGSTGLIGSRVVQELASDYRMIGLDLKRPKKRTDGDFVQCDLTGDTSVAEAFKTIRERHGDRLASVIHLAAYYDFTGEPSELYERLTVKGTLRLLKALKDFQVEQFVFSSTILVMEPSKENELLTETSPLEEQPWDYPRSKIKTEKLIRFERGEIPSVILRIGGVYDEYGHSLPIAQQISRIYQRDIESYFFPGNASHGQAFVHLDDLVSCFCKVVERRATLNPIEVFLIAEPELMSYRNLQDEIGRLVRGEEWTTVWIPKFVAKAGAWARNIIGGHEKTFIKPWMIDLADAHYPVSIEHAQQKLAWRPQHRLRSTLLEIIRRLRQDPAGWFEANNLPVPEDLREEGTERKRTA
jgi:nucleoside-diphosphate-sugar epimerase